MLKPLIVWISTNWKNCKEIGVPDHFDYHLRNLYTGQESTDRPRHETTDWFKLGKEYDKAIYCHPAYLTSMQSILIFLRGTVVKNSLGNTGDVGSIPGLRRYSEVGNGNQIQDSC